MEHCIYGLSDSRKSSWRILCLARMFHPFLNLAGDMAKLGWFALTGNQTSIKP